METDLEITLMTLLSTVMFLGGIGFILVGGPTLAVAGVVLIILSTIVLLVDMRDVIGHWGQLAGNEA